jgi:hypothetical protein
VLRNCKRLPRIDVQPVDVQRAKNTRDIVSALSAKAGFFWAKLSQCGIFSDNLKKMLKPRQTMWTRKTL